MRIQCKELANLSDLSHCAMLKASASIVRARGQSFPASGGILDGRNRRQNRKSKRQKVLKSINRVETNRMMERKRGG